jgi:2-methylisocitrate lyase-like PEP mutase family enzyme
MSEMVGNARHIAAAVDLPVIADADTGYGNELNVFRTVREFETAGVAGIRYRQVVGCWIVKGAIDRSTVVGRRDHAAMATPATSAQVANAWRRAK